MRGLERVLKVVNRCLMILGGIALVGMMFLACANMFLRVAWVPVTGSYEIVGFLGAIVAAFALGHTQVKRGHTAVDIVVGRLSRRAQALVDSISYFISMILFGLAAWRVGVHATRLYSTGELTETLRIVFFPFTYAVAVGCAVLALVLLNDFISTIRSFKYVTTGPYRLFVDFIRAHRGRGEE